MKTKEVNQPIPESIVVNGINVSNLHSTIDAVQENATVAKFNFRLKNKWIDGSQTTSTIKTFHGACQDFERPTPFALQTDEPAVLLGRDTAPNPGEYLLTALAACVTTSIVYHAAAKGVEIEEIESTIEGDVDLRGFLALDQGVRKGFQGIRISFDICADVTDEELRELVATGSAFSPVLDSITNGVAISVNAQRMAVKSAADAA